MRKLLLSLAMIVGLAMASRAQVVAPITVTSTRSAVVATAGGFSAVLYENSVTPTAIFSVISGPINGSSVNVGAGGSFVFTRAAGNPFQVGDTLGYVTSTTSGPFTFTMLQYASPPGAVQATRCPSTQFINQVNPDGSFVCAAGSTGGTPGGSSGQVQFNNSGAFGGFTVSGDCSLVTSTGAITCGKTGGVTFAPIATSGSAADLSAGTVAAARGGAGAISGALKGNGSGVVSQAACADLSNAAASCSTDATNAANIASGILLAARMPAFTGDCTTASGAVAVTCGSAIARTGTDINTSNQVTATHLASALPVAQGGTAGATAAAALINLFPTATRAGDLIYCATFSTGACTSWALLAGNNSGTLYLQETASGVPSWTAPSSGVAWSAITAPSGALSLSMGSNTSNFNTTTAVSQFFSFKNTTAAVVGTSQGSPVIALCGRAFHGSADVEDCMTFSTLPGNGNDAAIAFTIGHTGTSTGALSLNWAGTITAQRTTAANPVAFNFAGSTGSGLGADASGALATALYNGGVEKLSASGSFGILAPSTTGFGFASSTSMIDVDTAWCRNAAGVLEASTSGATGSCNQLGSTTALAASVNDGGNSGSSFGSKQTNQASACETSFGATTLGTGATTTDTGQNCLPANAVIDAVVYRITTAITTSASFTIGDATTAARFCGTQSTLTLGTTGICFVQADQTGAGGPRQTAAAKIRITLNANPGAGAIRLITYYHTWTAPTS